MEKITKKNMFMALVNFAKNGSMSFDTEDGAVIVSNEQLAAFAENEIALMEKKAAKAKETAKTKKTEDPLLAAVYDALSDEYEIAADIALRVECPEVDEITIGKVQNRINALIKDGKAEKTDVKVDKRSIKAYRRV